MIISVIMPMLEYSTNVENTIRSVIVQDCIYKIEFIIVNCTRKTIQKKLYDKNIINKTSDINIRIIESKSNNVGNAFWEGYRISTGEIITWLNSSCKYFGNALNIIGDVFREKEFQWIIGRENLTNKKGENGEKSILRYYPSFLIQNGGFNLYSDIKISLGNVFWRRELMQYIEKYKYEKMKYANDYLLWYEFSKHTKLYTVNKDLCLVNSEIQQKRISNENYIFEIRELLKETSVFSFRDKTIIKSYNKICNNEGLIKFEHIEYDSILDKYILRSYNKYASSNIKVSIITVCRNEKNIRYTCESVVNQTYDNYEWIVIDGKSTDNTIDVLNEYKDKIDIFISEPDNGIYSAMNKGIDRASGEWLIFLNGGDQFCEFDVLKKIFGSCNYCEASVLYGNEERYERDGRHYVYNLPNTIPRYFLCYQAFAHQSMFYRRELFEKYGGYDESYRITGDSEKNTQLLVSNEKFQKIDITVSTFVLDGISNDTEYQRILSEERYRRRAKYYTDKEIYLYSNGVQEYQKKMEIPMIKIKSFKAGKIKKYYFLNHILVLTAERIF